MIFLSLDGEELDLQQADYVYVGWRMIKEKKCYVIFVDIAGRQHTLVSTGDNRQQACFHCEAIRQCLGMSDPNKPKSSKGDFSLQSNSKRS